MLIDPHAAWHEPTRQAELVLHGAAAPACDALAAALEMLSAERDPAWLASWREADARVAPGTGGRAGPVRAEGMGGAGAACWATARSPGSASSMPIRDVEAFFPSSAAQIRFLANRGANGIDGTIASAAGAARATGAPVTVLLGELALLHDLGGLLAARTRRDPADAWCARTTAAEASSTSCRWPGAADPGAYEEHIATPAGLDLAAVAALAGIEHRMASTAAEVREAAASGPGLVEFRTDRADSVRMHREVVERVIGDPLG